MFTDTDSTKNDFAKACALKNICVEETVRLLYAVNNS